MKREDLTAKCYYEEAFVVNRCYLSKETVQEIFDDVLAELKNDPDYKEYTEEDLIMTDIFQEMFEEWLREEAWESEMECVSGDIESTYFEDTI